MKLYVTIGTTTIPIEKEYELPDGVYATYLGMEIDADKDNEGWVNGRQAILRTTFVTGEMSFDKFLEMTATIQELENEVGTLKEELADKSSE